MVSVLNKQQAHYLNVHNQQKQQYRKQLSQSFRDILENTLLINGMCQTSLVPPQTSTSPSNSNSTSYLNNPNYHQNHYEQSRNHSIGYLNSNNNDNIDNKIQSAQTMSITYKNHSSINDQAINEESLNKFKSSNQTVNQINSPTTSVLASPTTSVVPPSQIPTTPVLVNNEIAIKFAQLEHTLAITKAENNNLLEQQVIIKLLLTLTSILYLIA